MGTSTYSSPPPALWRRLLPRYTHTRTHTHTYTHTHTHTPTRTNTHTHTHAHAQGGQEAAGAIILVINAAFLVACAGAVLRFSWPMLQDRMGKVK